MRQANLLRIGEVHALLRGEFPDIELSKIRYYEEQGLVSPQRSRKGYRLYTERNVECLREAFRLTTQENASLRTARLRLIDLGLLDQTAQPAPARRAAREAVAPSVTAPIPTNVPPAKPALQVVPAGENVVEPASTLFEADQGVSTHLSHTQLLNMTGLSEAEVVELVACGILQPSSSMREPMYSPVDLTMASLSRKLLARGVDLRLLSAVRRSAEREVGVIEDMTVAIRENAHLLSVDSVRSQVAEVASDVAQLRSALFSRALSQYLGD